MNANIVRRILTHAWAECAAVSWIFARCGDRRRKKFPCTNPMRFRAFMYARMERIRKACSWAGAYRGGPACPPGLRIPPRGRTHRCAPTVSSYGLFVLMPTTMARAAAAPARQPRLMTAVLRGEKLQDFTTAKAAHDVIVDHSGRLHMGIANRRADELETALF